MKKFVIVFILFSTGCNFVFPEPATNEEIITETKKCSDAGLKSYQDFNLHVHCSTEAAK